MSQSRQLLTRVRADNSSHELWQTTPYTSQSRQLLTRVARADNFLNRLQQQSSQKLEEMTLHTNQGRHFFNHPKQTTFFISRSDYSFHQFEQTIPYTNQNTQLLHKLELTIPLTSACNASHQPKDKQLPTLKQLVLRLTVLRMMEKSVARVDSGKRKVIFRPCELHCESLSQLPEQLTFCLCGTAAVYFSV